MNREFLGWDQPLLDRVMTWLAPPGGGCWDLRDWILVLPTRRSLRELRKRIARRAESDSLELRAPRFVTVGELPEQLYRPAAPAALELEQTLAWTRVLHEASPDKLQPLMPNRLAAEPIGPWMDLATAVRRLHESLAADDLTFGDVAEAVESSSERRRWDLLAELKTEYDAVLQQAGCQDPSEARRQAVQEGRCQTERRIALIGTSDMNRMLCRMLAAVSDRVSLLIAAPPGEAILFDRYGNVEPEEWKKRELPLRDEHLVSAGDPPQQAQAAAASLKEFGSLSSGTRVTVGVTDEAMVPVLETELQLSGIATHRELGWPLSQTAPGRLLQRIGWLQSRKTWQALAALVRHADVYDWMERQDEGSLSGDAPAVHWLTQLDQLQAAHFPTALDAPLPPVARERYPAGVAVAERVQQWLAPLSGPPRNVAAWCEAISGCLEAIYGPPPAEAAGGAAPAEGDVPAVATKAALAIARLRRILDRLSRLTAALDLDLPAAAALEMLFNRLADAPIVLPREHDQLDLVGWLDLALDDAPAMVVVGLNQPFVPESITTDPFLPGSLRAKLKMIDNDRRFARDAYAMQLILATRRQVRFIVGRSGVDGSPTPPSRLLSAASGADVARRILRLLDQPPSVPSADHRWTGDRPRSALPIPPAGPAEVRVMSVTAFSDYLRCPYRFYLRHCLKLRPLDDAAGELAANQFGDLVHAAVEDFGRHPQHRQATDEGEILEHLRSHLLAYVAKYYGDHPTAAVFLQIEQAQRRLEAVAGAQARRRAEGWEIYDTEAEVGPDQGAFIKIGRRKMGLRGRFDRIDHHPDTNRWAILDYKTHGHKPEKKHLDANGAWIDLQLPLYRRMAPALGIEVPADEIELGYFNVAQKPEETGIHLAEFSAQQFAEADAVIEDCIGRIWKNDFDISPDPILYDDYAMICQTGLATAWFDDADQEVPG